MYIFVLQSIMPQGLVLSSVTVIVVGRPGDMCTVETYIRDYEELPQEALALAGLCEKTEM